MFFDLIHLLTGKTSGGKAARRRNPRRGARLLLETLEDRTAPAVLAVGGAPETTTEGTAFANPLQVLVTDGLGKPSANVAVTFAVHPANSGASATLSSSTALTDANGIATVLPVANIRSGDYTVTAQAAGNIGTATFALDNTFSPIAGFGTVSGTPQTAVVGKTFSAPLQIAVSDEFGNPLSGALVVFTVNAGPGGAGATLSSRFAATDANGFAQVSGIANGRAGGYTVTATIPGVAGAATFQLINLAPAKSATVTTVSGTAQSAATDTDFATPLEVRVTDASGAPVAGATVSFTVSTGVNGASAVLSAASVTTGADGTAAVSAHANMIAGSFVVTAKVAGASTSASFRLTNLDASSLFMQPQSTVVDTAFPLLQFPLESATFSISPAANGASAIPVVAGDTLFLVANRVAGSYTVTVLDGPGGTPIAVLQLTNLAGAPAAITAVGNTTESAGVGKSFQALQVKATDAFGNPVAGVPVSFVANADLRAANVILSAPSAITGTDGIAVVGATADLVAGSYTVTASAPGVGSATFHLTNLAVPVATHVHFLGSAPSAAVGTAFPALVFEATDAFGNPVAGVSISFAVTAGANGANATLSATHATTGADGTVSVIATANSTLGFSTLTARLAGGSSQVNVLLTNVVGAPASITIVSGSPQSATEGTAFANPLQVVVKDAFGHLAANAVVTFTVHAGSSGAAATLPSFTVKTDANGIASITPTANANVGAYTITAQAAGAPATVTFTLDNTFSPVAGVGAAQGTPQSATVGNAFTTPLLVEVTDEFGNPLSGVFVVFTVNTGPGGAGANLSFSVVQSDANGFAQVNATADNVAGAYTVTATVPGFPGSATFQLTNRAGAPASRKVRSS